MVGAQGGGMGGGNAMGMGNSNATTCVTDADCTAAGSACLPGPVQGARSICRQAPTACTTDADCANVEGAACLPGKGGANVCRVNNNDRTTPAPTGMGGNNNNNNNNTRLSVCTADDECAGTDKCLDTPIRGGGGGGRARRQGTGGNAGGMGGMGQAAQTIKICRTPPTTCTSDDDCEEGRSCAARRQSPNNAGTAGAAGAEEHYCIRIQGVVANSTDTGMGVGTIVNRTRPTITFCDTNDECDAENNEICGARRQAGSNNNGMGGGGRARRQGGGGNAGGRGGNTNADRKVCLVPRQEQQTVTANRTIPHACNSTDDCTDADICRQWRGRAGNNNIGMGGMGGMGGGGGGRARRQSGGGMGGNGSNAGGRPTTCETDADCSEDATSCLPAPQGSNKICRNTPTACTTDADCADVEGATCLPGQGGATICRKNGGKTGDPTRTSRPTPTTRPTPTGRPTRISCTTHADCADVEGAACLPGQGGATFCRVGQANDGKTGGDKSMGVGSTTAAAKTMAMFNDDITPATPQHPPMVCVAPPATAAAECESDADCDGTSLCEDLAVEDASVKKCMAPSEVTTGEVTEEVVTSVTCSADTDCEDTETCSGLGSAMACMTPAIGELTQAVACEDDANCYNGDYCANLSGLDMAVCAQLPEGISVDVSVEEAAAAVAAASAAGRPAENNGNGANPTDAPPDANGSSGGNTNSGIIVAVTIVLVAVVAAIAVVAVKRGGSSSASPPSRSLGDDIEIGAGGFSNPAYAATPASANPTYDDSVPYTTDVTA